MHTIPGYKIQRLIGEGGMAIVYLAVQESLQREVAIKIIDPSHVMDDETRQRFQQESHTIAQLDHPNIVTIHEVGQTEQGGLFFSMEYLPGGDLNTFKKTNDELKLIKVLRKIGDGLAIAHDKGFIHRDLKPENILFNSSGDPIITDWGISRVINRNDRLTRTGTSIGTSRYMCPEQARGEDVDFRADIYSMGTMIYELLSGQAPFTGDDNFAVAYAHIHMPVPMLTRRYAKWQTLIDTAMAKIPSGRFDNVQALDQHLEKLQRRVENNDHTSSLNYDIKIAHRWLTGHPIIATLVFMTIIAIPFSLFQFQRSQFAIHQNDTKTTAIQVNSINEEITTAPEEQDRSTQTFIQAATITQQAVQTGEASSSMDNILAKKLIAEGDAFLKINALMSPPVDNAVNRYMSVWRARTNSAAAISGLTQVIEQYSTLADTAIQQKDNQLLIGYVTRSRAVARDANLSKLKPLDSLERKSFKYFIQQTNHAIRKINKKSAHRLLNIAKTINNSDKQISNKEAQIAALPDRGDIIKDTQGPDLVFISPGNTNIQRGGRKVRLSIDSGFAIMQHEVTVDEYSLFAKATRRSSSRCGATVTTLFKKYTWNKPPFKQTNDHPVVCLVWEDAVAYAKWMSMRTGHSYRLPTEAEWEYTASFKRSLKQTCKVANLADTSKIAKVIGLEIYPCNDAAAYTAPVGSYRSNRLDIYDIEGNVSEWTSQCIDNDQGKCTRHVIRGGAWPLGPDHSPIEYRSVELPRSARSHIGFRLVRDI